METPLSFSEKGFNSFLKGLTACESESLIYGKAHIILDFERIDDFEDNSILITEQTSPECTVAIERAKAVLTERGGILCHAAIVCRDMQKPCIVGIKGILANLHHGQEVCICTKSGAVYY